MCITITAITITPRRVTIVTTITTMISITVEITIIMKRPSQDLTFANDKHRPWIFNKTRQRHPCNKRLLITKFVYYTIPIPNDNSSNMSKSITISLKIMMTSGFSLTMSIVLGYLTRQEKYIFAWLSRGYESLHINAGTSTG